MSIAIALHIMSAIIWVGGMFFAYVALRPAAVEILEVPHRLKLWVAVFRRFFPWVWAAVIALLVTGYWMIFMVFGGFTNTGIYVHLMHGFGLVMTAIYLFVFFVPYRKLRDAVSRSDFPAGGAELARIRKLIATNLSLGILTAILASGGQFWLN